MSACHNFCVAQTRRSALWRAASGFGGLSLAAMLGQQNAAGGALRHGLAANVEVRPLPHFVPRAKRVIFLFMWGGPSHVDLFDHKPRLNEFAGRSVTAEAWGGSDVPGGTILGSPFGFRRHGESGVEISELFPELSRHADRMCVIRSMHTDGSAHGEALLNLHTGSATFVRPSV
ncbi:MAG: hypothetical protein RLZZ458_3708, partial [Planctomycetota bacterium]